MLSAFVGGVASTLAMVALWGPPHPVVSRSGEEAEAVALEPRVRHAAVPPRLEPDRPVIRPDVGHEDSDLAPGRESTRALVDELRGRRLLIPLASIEARSLRSSFRETRGSGREHEAIDILAPRHTAVRAVEDGVIAKLFLSKAGGITVYQFDPSGRFVYYYAHLERYADDLREGAAVRRGQTLGFVGTSGNAPPDTPHLHFAIFRLGDDRRWWDGDPIDPFEVWRAD